MIKRLKLEYLEKVKILKRFKKYFWDHPANKIILEKFIYRILLYGDFEDIRWVYKKYPEETYKIALKYPEIKRGVKSWIKWWHDGT